ncbi:MAG: SDR family oxidoreductase [Verrucomicrobia bacterium]|nr:SDR family oxidoreductase [Verrucomicrobiota bacterium]MBI3870284.1 SDR family oxidoreductase [Verrucomicrobiota bacterium]
MNPRLQGRIAVVTGAGRGLGRQTALCLAAHGAEVALVARHETELRESLEQIEAAGGNGWICAADISAAVDVERLRRRLEERAPAASILVNAAGAFGPIQLIRESDPQRWIDTLAVNTLGPYLTCRAFLNGMIEAGWGRIINFSSAAALHPPGPLNSAYATSKAALNQFTRHLAAELEGTGVTANVIHPGDVKTEMWSVIAEEANARGPEAAPYREWARWVEQTGGDDPRKAADLVLRLVSDASASINGQFLWIEGGLQAPIPSWGDAAGRLPWSQDEAGPPQPERPAR